MKFPIPQFISRSHHLTLAAKSQVESITKDAVSSPSLRSSYRSSAILRLLQDNAKFRVSASNLFQRKFASFQVRMPIVIKAGELFVRVAGISGALAVALGAYGAHGMKDQAPEVKQTFETGNRYHFLHTLALLAVPFTKNPTLSGCLLSVGMLLFSGTCYFSALSGSTALNRLAPIGGLTLIVGWASMAL